MINLKVFNHHNFYLFGLVVLVVGLPWSPFLISLSQAILLANWLLEGGFLFKIKFLEQNEKELYNNIKKLEIEINIIKTNIFYKLLHFIKLI